MLATRGIVAECSSTTTHSRRGCAMRARGHSRSTSRVWGATARINCRKLEAGRADANEASEEIAATMITICREGQWAVRSRQLAVGRGSWQGAVIDACLLPTATCPLPTAHCPLPTAHCPLPTIMKVKRTEDGFLVVLDAGDEIIESLKEIAANERI